MKGRGLGWFSRAYTHHDQLFYQIHNEILQYAIFQSDARPSSIEELTMSHLHSYLDMRGYIKGIGAMAAEARISASAEGYIKGIGAMSTEARSEESAEGYTKGIGAMSAEAMSEASTKGESMPASFNDKLGIKWEQQYTEFKGHVGIPERGSKRRNLYIWKMI